MAMDLPHLHISGMEFLTTFLYVVIAIGILHVIARKVGEDHPMGQALLGCFA
jgi:hypothetical protein